ARVAARWPEGGGVCACLEAIFTGARALARLPAGGGRQRVLNWALDRFTGEPIVVVSSPIAATPEPARALSGDAVSSGRARRRSLRASTAREDAVDDPLDDPLDDLFDVLPPPVFDDSDIAAAMAMRREQRIRAALSSFISACR